MGVQVTIALWMALASGGDIPGVTTLRPLPASAGTRAPANTAGFDVRSSPRRLPPTLRKHRPSRRPITPPKNCSRSRAFCSSASSTANSQCRAAPSRAARRATRSRPEKPLDMKKLSDALRFLRRRRGPGRHRTDHQHRFPFRLDPGSHQRRREEAFPPARPSHDWNGHCGNGAASGDAILRPAAAAGRHACARLLAAFRT